MKDLDKFIKTKFKLFHGLRSEKEDALIYNKVSGHCLRTVMDFMANNLSDEIMKSFWDEVSSKQNLGQKMQVLADYLKKIDNFEKRLAFRLSFSVNKLLLDSLRNQYAIRRTR